MASHETPPPRSRLRSFFSPSIRLSSLYRKQYPKRKTVAAPVFTLFPLLPAEIRIQIWQYTFVPQLIQSTEFQYFQASAHPPPVALHINHESRTEALACYRHLDVGGLYLTTKSSMQTVWFSPSLDVIEVCGDPWRYANPIRLLKEQRPWGNKESKRLEIWSHNLALANFCMNSRIIDHGTPQALYVRDMLLAVGGVIQVVFRFLVVVGYQPSKDYETFLLKVWHWYGEWMKSKPSLDFKPPKILRVVANEGTWLAELKDGELVTARPTERVTDPLWRAIESLQHCTERYYV